MNYKKIGAYIAGSFMLSTVVLILFLNYAVKDVPPIENQLLELKAKQEANASVTENTLEKSGVQVTNEQFVIREEDSVQHVLNTIPYDRALSGVIGSIATISDPAGTRIPLRLASTARCQVGDLDIIRRDFLLHNVKPEVLVTVEPILDKDTFFQKKAVQYGLDEFILGSSFALKVKLYEPPVQAGIYICSDSEKTNQCVGKEVIDINEIASDTLFQKKSKKIFKDKVYYFANILIDTNGIQVFKEVLDESGYEKVQNAHQNLFGGKYDITKVFEKIRNIHKNLSSVPPKISMGTIEIDLPRLDRSKCPA
jgi:hypothetical protein